MTKLKKLKLALWYEFSYCRFKREYRDTFKVIGTCLMMMVSGVGGIIGASYCLFRLLIIPIILLVSPFFFIWMPDEAFENIIKIKNSRR